MRWGCAVKNRQEGEDEKPCIEGLATHDDPASCTNGRKAGGEALTGAHTGGPSRREINTIEMPTLLGAASAIPWIDRLSTQHLQIALRAFVLTNSLRELATRERQPQPHHPQPQTREPQLSNRDLQLQTRELQPQTRELQLQTRELQRQTRELQLQTRELQRQTLVLQTQTLALQSQTREIQHSKSCRGSRTARGGMATGHGAGLQS